MVGCTSLLTWLQLEHILCWVLYLKLTLFQTSRDLQNPWQVCIIPSWDNYEQMVNIKSFLWCLGEWC